MFKKSIIVTRANGAVHISCNKHVVVLPENIGFSYIHGSFTPANETEGFECSESEFKKIRAQYHRALKVRGAPHKVWALAFTVTAMWGLAVVPFDGEKFVENARLGESSQHIAPSEDSQPVTTNSAPAQNNASASEYPFPNS